MFSRLAVRTGRKQSVFHQYQRSKSISFPHSSAVPSRRLGASRRLEVERKFLATPAAVAYIRSNGSGAVVGFTKHEKLGKQMTHDVYFDHETLLFSKGIYVRQRNGHWEAKIRKSGDFINSAFTEIDGYDAVNEMIRQNLLAPVKECSSIQEILNPCAEFVTERESWMMDGRFRVDIDSTNFGHTIGEVELTADLQHDCSEEHERRIRDRMDQDIMVFMQSYPLAFPTGRPLGKLSAYFENLRRGR